MAIHFGPVGHDGKPLNPIIINKRDTYFEFDGFKCAVFKKGGCDLTVKLSDERTITLRSQFGGLFGQVFSSKLSAVECYLFSVLIDYEPVFIPSEININKGVLHFKSKTINFSIDLNQLNFNDETFRNVIRSEMEAAPKIRLEDIIKGMDKT